MSNKASELEAAIRLTLYSDVVNMCEEIFHHFGFEANRSVMGIIAELVYYKLSIYRLDLKAFATHAGRKTIKEKDVELLVRRNPTLKSHLYSKYSEKQNVNLPSTSKDPTSPN